MRSHRYKKNSPSLDLINSNLKTATHVALVGVPVGFVVGSAIAAYDYVVNTLLWENFTQNFSPTILCFFPIVGMLLTGLILQLGKVKSTSMADEVVRAYHEPKKGINYKDALPKLVASIATMGFGCSAGMEGASKWLGGSIAAFIQKGLNRVKWLKAGHGKVETTMLAGAAAGISAIFRAPLTGAIMGIESPYKKDIAHDALIHGLVASAVSYATFVSFRNANSYFPLTFSYTLNVRDLILCVPLGILAGLSSNFFIFYLNLIKKYSADLHPFVRYLLGGIFLSTIAYALVFMINDPATLQAGLPVSNRLLNGHYNGSACALIFFGKLFATAITFGMGGVGGLFVPSATIGAALGALCDLYFFPSQSGLFTLVGIAAFTGASYNSLLFSAVFIAEATGNPALVVPGLIASCTAYLISSGVSNSSSQKFQRVDVISIPEEKGEN